MKEKDSMRKCTTILLLCIFAVSNDAFSQYIFSETYTGCDTDRFTLESDSCIAKITDEDFISVITSGFTDKVKNKIKGTLSLQIIVDPQGNSCLISLKNETNVKTRRLKLKQAIDNFLKWETSYKKVAAIVLLDFDEEDIQLTRFGMNSEKGVHVLNY